MQPAAAQIDGSLQVVADRPRPSAKPRARFDQEAIDPGVPEPPARGNASRAAADNHHLGIAACHALCFDDLERRTIALRSYNDRRTAHEPSRSLMMEQNAL
jgi:hypothetical protein